jgi:hypothetical protein
MPAGREGRLQRLGVGRQELVEGPGRPAGQVANGGCCRGQRTVSYLARERGDVACERRREATGQQRGGEPGRRQGDRRDRPSQCGRQLFRDAGPGERLRAGEVVAFRGPARAGQQRGRARGDVVAVDVSDRAPAVAVDELAVDRQGGRAGEKVLHEAARPQDGPAEAGRLEVFLDTPVRSGGEQATRAGPQDRYLHDPRHARGHGGVDGALLLPDHRLVPVRGHRAAGVEEQPVDAAQRAGDRAGIVEIADGEVAAQFPALFLIADQCQEWHLPLPQIRNESPADGPGRAGYQDHCCPPVLSADRAPAGSAAGWLK